MGKCRLAGCQAAKPESCRRFRDGIPDCMRLIRPEDVVRAVQQFYEGGRLKMTGGKP